MNNSKCRLSVILASYKEAENLSMLLPKLKETLEGLTPNHEVIVVDTMQPLDNTQQVCKENGVRYLLRKGGNNYGDAIRTGIKASTGDHVVIMDADGSHTPKFIEKMWQQKDAADVVIASRYVDGGNTDNPWLLVTMSRLLNVGFKYIVKLPVLDVSNSFRLYSGDSLRGLELTYQHFDILEEILAKLFWEGPTPVKVLEIPFSFERRYLGKSKRNLFAFLYHFVFAIYRLRGLRKQFKAKPNRQLV